MEHPVTPAKFGDEMLRFAASVDTLERPEDVLDALHTVTLEHLQVNVLGAAMFPLRAGQYDAFEAGTTAFLHTSTPRGWWPEYSELSKQHPAPALMLAQMSLSPFTTSDMLHQMEPLGVDRWSIELGLKYGMRDFLSCPVGGRWVLVYWSKQVFSKRLKDEERAILFMGATFAVIRLQKLLGTQPSRIGRGAALTPRELSVLRLLSLGHQVSKVAELLELGEETIRTHIKKAAAKLGTKNRTHAIAQAIRLRLIP
jgi:DNA-binding CsgD family transcriptional regulator